jgi:hypothetical protein
VQLPHRIVYPKKTRAQHSHAAIAYLFGKSASTRLPRRAAPPDDRSLPLEHLQETAPTPCCSI